MTLSRKIVGCFSATGLTLLAAVGAASAQTTVAATGYNRDIVFAGGTDAFTPLDVAGYGFDTTATDASGLPTSGFFSSATASGAVYTLQSYSAPNALVMAKGTSGILTVTVPAAFTKIDILATQTSAGSSPGGSGIFTYTDNTTSSFTFIAPDWGTTSSASAITISRYSTGGTQAGFHLYETALTPTAGKLVKSITFTAGATGTSADENTAIMAISGIAATPEPSQYAALGLGVFGLAGLALKARRRVAA